MLAEIHNKISQTGNNLSDRLEDKLTGDFFGTIRYLPFELGLKHVFTSAEFIKNYTNKNWLEFIEEQKGYIAQIDFWHREEEGEIDILITINQTIIGVEVKYLSGVSSEDQDDQLQISHLESLNQLARYSRMLKKLSNGQKTYLLFLAPYEMMNTIKKNIMNRSIISPSVELGFICWQDILESLKSLNLDQLEIGQQLVLNDLQTLLTKKGFVRFNGFSIRAFDQTITRSSYSFRGTDFISKKAWIWPATIIKEDVYYAYKND